MTCHTEKERAGLSEAFAATPSVRMQSSTFHVFSPSAIQLPSPAPPLRR